MAACCVQPNLHLMCLAETQSAVGDPVFRAVPIVHKKAYPRVREASVIMAVRRCSAAAVGRHRQDAGGCNSFDLSRVILSYTGCTV